jgi:hypothetical protein
MQHSGRFDTVSCLNRLEANVGELEVKGREIGRRAIGERINQMRVMDKSGDTRIIWDPDNEDEVARSGSWPSGSARADARVSRSAPLIPRPKS